MKPWVLKFGGTSVGSVETLRGALDVVARSANHQPVVVVVSALAGVTDELLRAAEAAARGETPPQTFVPALRSRHLALLHAVAPAIGEQEWNLEVREPIFRLETLLAATALLRDTSLRTRDAIVSLGERLSVRLFAAALRARNLAAEPVDATELILTDDNFGAARVDLPASRKRTLARLRRVPHGCVPVVTGFIGAAPDGATATLGRGGSDYTAALIGAFLEAEAVEIWTDTDGVLTADPRLCPDATTLPRIGHAEARELARAGAKVLHPGTLDPLEAAGIAVAVRNTFRPDHPGTLIAPAGGAGDTPHRAVAMACEGDRAVVSLVGDNLRSEARLASRAVAALENAGIRILAVPESDSPRRFSLHVPSAHGPAAMRSLHRAFAAHAGRVNLVIAGHRGRVGKHLREQIALFRERDGRGPDLRVVGLLGREGLAWRSDGFRERVVDAALVDRTPHPADQIRRQAEELHGTPFVFVDCTASPDVSEVYPELLASGVAVVTANKRAGSQPLAGYRRLRAASARSGAPFLAATTVAAGLPVLKTTRSLLARGDRLRGVSAVLSGTLSFVLHRVQEGQPFSQAVAEAHRLGLTEPDPRVDLTGEDVARKLLILLREAAFERERDDIAVEPLLRFDLAGSARTDRILAELPAHDDEWARRADRARQAGRRLVYLARFDEKGARVGVTDMPHDDPAARVRPGEHLVALVTDRYRDLPLTLSGPGAGPEITAANLFGEVLEATDALERVRLAPSVVSPHRRPLKGGVLD